MPRAKDLTGMRFGELTAVKPTDKRDSGSIVWECACDCGQTCDVSARNLVNGHTKSCGHLVAGQLRRVRYLELLRPRNVLVRTTQDGLFGAVLANVAKRS